MKLDDKIVKLVQEIGRAVGELPEAVQEPAFQFLLERHLGQRTGPSVGAEPVVEGEAVSADWAARLADSVGVTGERVQSLVSVDDEETIHVLRPDLGEKEAHRNRNITLVALWAARVLNRDLYYPAAEVRRIIRELRLPIGNFVNNIRRHPNVRSLTLHKQKMLQLTGNWEESLAEIFAKYAA